MSKREHNHTVQLNLPEVQGNRVRFSWFPNHGFKTNHYWVEYPDLAHVTASSGKLAEAYFPVCLALAVKGLHIKLPVRISEEIINHWHRVIAIVMRQCFDTSISYAITNGTEPAYYQQAGNKTALCFGGGTESLLTLAHLMRQRTRPILASFGGPSWSGSNPENNPDKFAMDEKVARAFNLDLLRVRSNFREIISDEGWYGTLRRNVSMMNAVLLLPFFISLILPVSEQMGIATIVNGNEKMNFPEEYFCFSPAMTSAYGEIAAGVSYYSALGNLLKEEVCRELYRLYPEFAKYQYSCWRNQGQRWCYRCESCMEYYALLKTYGVSPSLVGLDENEIKAHREELAAAVSQSAESRRGELWQRMCQYPELQRDPFMRDFLKEIKERSRIYHSLKRFYNETPLWLKQIYRSQKTFLQRFRRREEFPNAVHAA